MPGINDLLGMPASRGDALAGVLRERILRGEYQRGAWLREADLRSEFNMSNGPVRDALSILASQGLAERVPARGVRVIDLTGKQLRDLFELRIALLSHAAELAIATASDDQLGHGRAIVADYLRGPRSYEGGQLSRWLLAASGNSVISEVWRKVVAPTLLYINAAGEGAGRARIHKFVGEVAEAVIARDITRARVAIRTLNEVILRAIEENQT